MFERFTRESRDVVETAQLVARSTGSSAIDARHVLIGLLERNTSVAAEVHSFGIQPERLAHELRDELRTGSLDADALESVGIDLDAVRERADAVFGQGALDRSSRQPPTGHIPFAPDAKKALELALREAIRLHAHRIDDRMLLLGLLRDTGSRAERALRTALTTAGSSVEELRAAMEVASAQAS